MTPEEKQSALLQYRTVLLATLDYLTQQVGGSLVYDGYDPVTEYYQQQKIQIEKYYTQRRLDRLQKRFASLTKGLQHSADLNLASFIKEKTGYDIDIFQDLRNRVDLIIARNEIRTQQELNDIGAMLHYYHQTLGKEEHVEKLTALLIGYHKNENAHKRKSRYEEVVSRTEKDGLQEVTIQISNGPKPKHFEEQEATSPDGKRSLRVTQWSDGKYASTYVVIHFPTSSGPIYGTLGIHPEIKAWWKDNSTIVINTKKEYDTGTQHKKVSSFDDVITIEYIEH